MPFYTVSVSNTALNSSSDTLTLIAASARRNYIHEVSIGGMGAASSANEFGVFRSTSGTTGGGAKTPAKLVTDSPAANTLCYTTWSAQPSLSGDPLMRLPVNANGAIYRWVAKPGEEIEFRNLEQISMRSVVGVSPISMHSIFEEV